MVVRLRLQRLGMKALPFYRIVAADARSKRDGKHIENLGTYVHVFIVDPIAPPPHAGGSLLQIRPFARQ